MRKLIALSFMLALGGCGGASAEDPVDTTLPNGTQPLNVIDNTDVIDVNATEGMDAIGNDLASPTMTDNNSLMAAPGSYPEQQPSEPEVAPSVEQPGTNNGTTD